MGFWGSIWKGIKKVGKTLFGGILGGATTTIGQSVGSAIGNKVTGVPTPQTTQEQIAGTGKPMGAEYKAFLEEAYPGTTPWEQLGAGSPMGQIASSAVSGKIQERLQQKKIQADHIMADKQYRAQVIGSATPMGSKAMHEALSAYEGAEPQNYDTQVTLAKQKLPTEIQKLKAETQQAIQKAAVTGHERDIKRAQALVSNDMALAELTAKESQNTVTAIKNFWHTMWRAGDKRKPKQRPNKQQIINSMKTSINPNMHLQGI